MSARPWSAHPVGLARSLLFVPADRPERFLKAARSGAEAVILDLEDAVPAERKALAREAVVAHWLALHDQPTPVLLRLDVSHGLDDARWLARAGLSPRAVVWPKAESATQLAAVRALLPETPLIPLIESVAGLDALSEIAAAPGVLRLAFGHLDFSLDAGIEVSAEQAELASVRFAMAMATRRHKLHPAIDGVSVDVSDQDRLRQDVQRGLHFGMRAKLCIHPQQIATVHRVLSPSEEELQWARRVLDAAAQAQGAAVQLDGAMVDAPVIKRAQALLGALA